MKSGFVAILGRPNAGKSTLLNALLSKKVSIVSPKAQTTRDAVIGILNEKDMQIVFVDTPGIHTGDRKLDSHMRRSAFSSSRDVDAIVYLFDAGEEDYEPDFKIIDSIRSEAKRIYVLNKIDLIDPLKGEAKLSAIRDRYPGATIMPASFKENFGIKEIKDAVEPLLSGDFPFYPTDQYTDKDLRFQAKEIIREKILRFLKEEVPHSSAVRITSFTYKNNAYYIEAEIIVDKTAHKAIVIGKGGAMIKKISMASRQQMEKDWHKRVGDLTIEVNCLPGWRDSPRALADLGYGDE